MKLPLGWTALGVVTLLSWAVAAAAILYYLWPTLPGTPQPGNPFVRSLTHDSPVMVAPSGHAYQYIAAPNITWEAARDAAARRNWRGHPGYLATLDDEAEYRFVLERVFADANTNTTYLGGRQTAPGQWRWVTGPDGAADGGKGRLFWRGDEQGQAADGAFANWMSPAFQHGTRWDVKKVCCVTLFSYGMPQFSTSLGNGYWEEGVAGYLVEYGG